VTQTEGYQISNSLSVTSYPFIAVLCSLNDQTTIIDRLEGFIGADDLINRLTGVLEDKGSILIEARANHEERRISRQIREEQDEAYERAIKVDREKERIKQEQLQKTREEEMRVKEEQDRIKYEQEKKEKFKLQETERKKRELPPEPLENESNVATVVVRLPDGTRLQRRLRLSDKLQVLYDFIDLSQNQVEINSYVLATNFPRQTFPDPNVTIEGAKLYPQALLFIQEK